MTPQDVAPGQGGEALPGVAQPGGITHHFDGTDHYCRRCNLPAANWRHLQPSVFYDYRWWMA